MLIRATFAAIGIVIAAVILTMVLPKGASSSIGSVSLPPPYATPSVYNWPQGIPQPDSAKLNVPTGFRVDPYADHFLLPRYMIQGRSGELLVADSVPKPGGRVSVLITKGEGLKVAGRKILISGLDLPYGMAFWKDYLYVAEVESVKRYRYDPQSMTAGAGEEVISLKGLRDWHWTRTLLFDREGKKLYVAVGSGSNSALGEDPRRAAINRYNPDGTGHEIYASGVRNPVGLRWYPGTDTLWATVQERDDMGDELVPDFFTHIQPGGFYGWPYAYIGPHEDPRNAGIRRMRHPLLWLETAFSVPELVRGTIVPDVLLGSHVAPLDAVFYTGKQFPAEYQGGAFVAFHGSVNRAKRVGYSVAFIPFRNGRPTGEMRSFLTGWMLSPDKPEVWGRPVGLLELSDGSLLVSDDGGRKLWRISYEGTRN